MYFPVFRWVIEKALPLDKASFSVLFKLLANVHCYDFQKGARTFKDYNDASDFFGLSVNTIKKALKDLENRKFVTVKRSEHLKTVNVKIRFQRPNEENVNSIKGGYLKIPLEIFKKELSENTLKVWLYNFKTSFGLFGQEKRILNFWAERDLKLSRASITKANKILVDKGLQTIFASLEEKSNCCFFHMINPEKQKTEKAKDKVQTVKSEEINQEVPAQELISEVNSEEITSEKSKSIEVPSGSIEVSSGSIHKYKEALKEPLVKNENLKGDFFNQISEEEKKRLFDFYFRRFKILASNSVYFKGVTLNKALFQELVNNVVEFGTIQRSTDLTKVNAYNPFAYLVSNDKRYGLTAERVHKRLQEQKKLGITNYSENQLKRFISKNPQLENPYITYGKIIEHLKSDGLNAEAISEKIENMDSVQVSSISEMIEKIEKESLKEFEEKFCSKPTKSQEEIAENKAKTKIVASVNKSAPKGTSILLIEKLVGDHWLTVQYLEKKNGKVTFNSLSEEISRLYSLGGVV